MKNKAAQRSSTIKDGYNTVGKYTPRYYQKAFMRAFEIRENTYSKEKLFVMAIEYKAKLLIKDKIIEVRDSLERAVVYENSTNLRDIIKEMPADKPMTSEDIFTAYRAGLMQLEEAEHYYIETNNLYYVLCEADIKDFEVLEKALNEINIIISRNIDNPYQNKVFMKQIVHGKKYIVHWRDTKETAYIFTASQYGDNIELTCLEPITGGHYTFGTEIGKEEVKQRKIEIFDKIKPIKGFKLFINMILYILTFPDLVSEEAPDITSDKMPTEREVMVKSQESIERQTEGSHKSAHFRKGFFKLLASEYYKNKRGNIIYIHPTFVGGNAFTLKEK